MCSALGDVRFVPIADKANLTADLRRGNDALRAELDELAKRVNHLDEPAERSAVVPHLRLRAVD